MSSAGCACSPRSVLPPTPPRCMTLLHLQPESGPRPHTSTFTCTLTCTAQAVCALSSVDKRSVMQERPTGSELLTSYYVVLTYYYGSYSHVYLLLPTPCPLTGRSCSLPWLPTSEGRCSPSYSALMLPDERAALLPLLEAFAAGPRPRKCLCLCARFTGALFASPCA